MEEDISSENVFVDARSRALRNHTEKDCAIREGQDMVVERDAAAIR
jgi:hypothetical protein